jgi:hypothetical protein
MNDIIADFIRTKGIDSFQKLRFLLFLNQRTQLIGTIQEFAEQLYLGDVALLKGIIKDLQKVGLMECTEGQLTLPEKADVKLALSHLAKAYEDPLSRQTILAQVKQTGLTNRVYRGW